MYPKMKIQKRGPLRSVPVARIVPVSRKARFREAYSAKRVLSPELQECMDRNEGGAATSTRGRYETATPQR